MPDHFDDIDLKTPRPYENVAPPSYTDAIRADTVTNPTPYSNTNYSAPNNEYSTPNPIGFDILHQQRPQPNHEPNYNYGQSYPPGTGGYPGAGMYNSSSPTSPQPTSYVIRRIDCPETVCESHRIQRRRRLVFVLSVFLAMMALSILFWIIF